MHLLYKICRADTPGALSTDFQIKASFETRSFDDTQNDAHDEMKAHMCTMENANGRVEGATWLWKAAEKGQELAVREILKHPDIDPNKKHGDTHTTPLYMAAHRGHVGVVKALLDHPKIQVNSGKMDTKASPLVAAAQEGREEAVTTLLGARDIDVNQSTTEGESPLCVACEFVHEHIVDHLLAANGINTDHKLRDGATAFSIAAKSTQIMTSFAS